MFGRKQSKNVQGNKRRSNVLLLIALVLVLVTHSTTLKTNAADNNLSWRRVPVPLERDPGGWVLAEGADIMCLEMSGDGALYCHATPSGTGQTLFKSVNKGRSWLPVGGVTDDIVAISTVPGSNMELYYATDSKIYKSIDAGYSFVPLPELASGLGNGNLHIKCIDVCKKGETNLIAVGTIDNDDNEYGGVYILDESQAVPTWADTDIGDYDVYSLAFSPDYLHTGHLVAVVADGMDICISNKVEDGDWNLDIGQAVIHGITPVSAIITFPHDYPDTAEDANLFVGINSDEGHGDVFKIDLEMAPAESTVIDLDIGSDYGLPGVDVSGLDNGESSTTWLFAGAANSTHIYYSKNNGVNWTRCNKKPTGRHITQVLLDNHFVDNNRIYTASTGTEGGLSCSVDRGTTWNQISLIDTKISPGCIVDLAVSPRYEDDQTMFMLTLDTNHIVHSLWRTENGGEYWERVFSSAVENKDIIDKIRISPFYGMAEQVVYLAGKSDGTPVIWKTGDNGKTFSKQYPPLKVDEWVVVNDEEFIIGCFDGTNSLIYTSGDSGQTYSAGAIAGKHKFTSISVSPEYTGDGTILAGNSNGEVYISNDYGLTFRLLPPDSETSPINGRMYIAFDPGFGINHIIYAAGDAVNNGIYRFTIDQSDDWEKINDNFPEGGVARGLGVSKNGVLYAINAQAVNVPDNKGGVERSLNPSFQLSPGFETIAKGLSEDCTLSGLWVAGDRIWTIDTTNTRLLTYHDTMASRVVLHTPVDDSTGLDTRNLLLNWEELPGATEYIWQMDYDGTFTSIPSNFEGETTGNSIRLPELDTDTGYYWRIRATKPILSPWSDTWSFATLLGQTIVGPKLISPDAGAGLVSPEPIFQWSAVTGAEKYELIVSTDISFADTVIRKTGRNALPATAWKSDVLLEGDNTYYWKVRALGIDSYGDWSAVSIFSTQTDEPDEISEPAVCDIRSPIIRNPGTGSESIPVNPLFQWDAVLGADSYELVVAPDISFDNPVILKAGEYTLKTTAWKSNISLENDKTYYWKVRTLMDGSYSDWSSVSEFSTEIPYEVPKDTVMDETPILPIQSQTNTTSDGFPAWGLYLGIGLLVALVLLQTTTFFMVVFTQAKLR